jgi:large subunit ribosomal protein L7/L12
MHRRLVLGQSLLRLRMFVQSACPKQLCGTPGISAFSCTSINIANRTRRRSMIAAFHTTRGLMVEEAALSSNDTTKAVADAEDSTAEGDSEGPHPTEIHYAFTPPPPLSEESQENVKTLFDKILYLDMIEVHMLTNLVHEQMGVKWSEVDNSRGPSVMAAQPTAEEVPPEKSLNDVKLVGFDAKAKIKVIKEVRAIAGLGLKEAKEMVESAPKVIQKDLKPEKAEELKARLEAIGAVVEIV